MADDSNRAGPSTPRPKASSRSDSLDSQHWHDESSSVSSAHASAASPRRRQGKVLKRTTTPKKTPRIAPVPSPRPKPRPQQTMEPPPPPRRRRNLLHTLGLLLMPIRPLLDHVVNTVILAIILVVTVCLLLWRGPYLLWYSLKLIASLLNLPQPPDFLATLSLSSSLHYPLRLVATPTCMLAGSLCRHSLYTQNGTIAHSIWQSQPDLDVARVAIGLTEQVRGATDIYKSVSLLANNELAQGLDYSKILELGQAIRVGSTVEDKDFLSEKIYDLGLLARDISDGVMLITSMTTSAFQWLEMDFKRLVELLSPASRPNTLVIRGQDSAILRGRLDRTLQELDRALGALHERTDALRRLALMGVTNGAAIDMHARRIHSDLRTEQDRLPGWQPAVDGVRHFLLGGDPSKSAVLRRDLDAMTRTISQMSIISERVESVRTHMTVYRDQLDMFRASVMGFHLGASESVGLGPEEEVRILAQAVDMFGIAAGGAGQREAKAIEPKR